MNLGDLLLGAITMACFTIGLFFLRFWKTTLDRLFLYLAASFFVEGAERIAIGIIPHSSEDEPLFYLLRLLAFGILLYGIMEKNRWMRGKR
jgi:hypothetical protein